MIKIVRAKLHGIRVTGADLNYHGSITLDPDHCRKASIYPLEFVEVWNKNSGARISTYVIFGEPGSGCCVLNGAAARTCQTGDELIITAAEYTTPDQLYDVKPSILTFLPGNRIDQVLEYDVFESAAREHDFRILDVEQHRPDLPHNYANVDVAAISGELRAKGWSDAEVADFVQNYLSR